MVAYGLRKKDGGKHSMKVCKGRERQQARAEVTTLFVEAA